MKIGIVGSGIAGLNTAYQLAKTGQEVVLFEKQTSLGMDAHGLVIERGSESVRADVPSRMFNELQWPTLVELYRELGVRFQPVQPTQSFSWLGGETFLKLDVANRPWLAVQSLVNPRIRKTVQESRRLQSQGEKDLAQQLPDEITFSEYLTKHRFDTHFVNEFLYPTLSSTVLTCSYTSLDNYPAKLILKTLKNLADSPSLLRTRNGTHDVVRRLTEPLDDVRLGLPVDHAEEHANGVEVEWGNERERYDHLVIATQANHATRLLPNSQLEGALGEFLYEDVEVTVHTDTKLMPADPADWSTFNMILPDSVRAAMCSVWLNQFHDQWNLDEPIIQTINPIVQPDAEKVLSHAVLQRPVVNKSSFKLWREILDYHQQSQRIWFAGSYAAAGVPLLESGVQASWNVVQQLTRPTQVSTV